MCFDCVRLARFLNQLEARENLNQLKLLVPMPAPAARIWPPLGIRRQRRAGLYSLGAAGLCIFPCCAT